jgi:hypothetical protein
MIARILALALAFFLAAPAASGAEVERYAVRAETAELEVNTRGELTVLVDAAAEHSLDGKYPAEAQVTAAVGDGALVVEKSHLRRGDAHYHKDGRSMSWKVGLVGKKAGSHPLKVRMKFHVCDDVGDCFEEIAELSLRVIVKS